VKATKRQKKRRDYIRYNAYNISLSINYAENMTMC